MTPEATVAATTAIDVRPSIDIGVDIDVEEGAVEPAVVELAASGSRAVDPGQLGVATIRERTSLASRMITSVAIIAPIVGLLSVGKLLWGVDLHPLDLYLFVAFYIATGLGITVGYHRLFTHKSFSAAQPVRIVLAILGAMTLQGPLTQWVTDHRKHHARSDAEGDPHSPNLRAPGAISRLRGFFHGHVGWLFSTKGMERGVIYGRDLYDDPVIRFIDRAYLLWVVLSVGLPFLIAFGITGSVTRGIEALVWAGLVRIFFFQHATFAVNSVCHVFGARPYVTGDKSTNNVIVALLTFGEGWHNNHHAFPRSARHGLKVMQMDMSYMCIRALAIVRLASEVRLPTETQRARVSRADA